MNHRTRIAGLLPITFGTSEATLDRFDFLVRCVHGIDMQHEPIRSPTSKRLTSPFVFINEFVINSAGILAVSGLFLAAEWLVDRMPRDTLCSFTPWPFQGQSYHVTPELLALTYDRMGIRSRDVANDWLYNYLAQAYPPTNPSPRLASIRQSNLSAESAPEITINASGDAGIVPVQASIPVEEVLAQGLSVCHALWMREDVGIIVSDHLDAVRDFFHIEWFTI